MIAIIVAALLAQAPDAPLRPPELIDERGNIVTFAGSDALGPGTVCLTHAKAVLERNSKAAKDARIAVLEAGSGVDWPLVLIVAGAGVLAAGAAAVGGYVVGRASK